MNWTSIHRLLDHLPAPPRIDPSDPAAALRVVEAAWDATPEDRHLAAAARALADAAAAGERLPVEVGGLRRERLVAWSGWTATWIGTDLTAGGEALIRVIRARDDDPVARRALARDGRALSGLVEGLRVGPTWLAAPLPGSALADAPGGDANRQARRLASAIGALAAWEAHRMWPSMVPELWREVGGRVVPVSLDPLPVGDAGPTLAWVASMLRSERDPDHAVEEALLALALAPPRRAADAVPVVTQALATELAGTRHALARRWRDTARHDRAARLLELIQRMDGALPPPEGEGAIGVDLDGRATAIASRPEGLWWGPRDAMVPLWTRRDGFDAPEARRMLRARAAVSAAPRRLETEPYTASAGRWVATALQTRTLRLLLEKELAAARDALDRR